jgi:hypothetical protein
MKLRIDRGKWLRGEGCDDSYLRRPSDEKMCCVGFYCLALGKTEKEITGIVWPYPILDAGVDSMPEEARWLDGAADGLAQANDDEDIEYRECDITDIFAQHSVEVEFFN